MFGWLIKLLPWRRANILYVWIDDDGRMRVEEISSLGNSQDASKDVSSGQDDQGH